MSDAGPDPDTTQLLADLTRTLRELRTELEPERRLRPPTPGELARFASEVAIPALVFLLQANIRALELLRRTLQLAQSRQQADETGAVADVRDRADDLSRATLARLDDALGDLRSALEGRPPDDDARELLARAQRLQRDLENELGADGRETVDVDVEAELRSLKNDLEDGDAGDPEK